MKFNRNVDTIFLDSSSNDFDVQEKVNVILSPSLYWVQKVSLPVKYLRDVKSLLPSLFEDILPEGVYSYSAYKYENDFLIFAYEDKLILDTLQGKGVASDKINNVYFAQNELNMIENAIAISDTQSVYMKDDILLIVPSSWLANSQDLDIESLTLSKNYIVLKQFSHLVNEKSLYTLAGIFSLLIFILVVEYFITAQKLTTTMELRDALFEKNALKPTMMQNRAMLQEYTSLHHVQINLREYSAYILSLKSHKGQSLSLLSLKNKKLIVEFSGINKGDETNILEVLNSKNLKFIASFKNKSWHLEIEL